jgi:hypothetical protein
MTCESKSSTISLNGWPFLLALAYLSFCSDSASARPDSLSHTVRVAPGPEYEAGSLYRFFYGDLWRDVWTEPVDVQVVDPETFAGGLTPLQNWSRGEDGKLFFRSARGTTYSFRLLDRSPQFVLPSEVRTVFAPERLHDLVATTNPYAGLVAAPLLRAVGVLSVEAQLVALSDSDLPNAFTDGYRGKPGILVSIPEFIEADTSGIRRIAGSPDLPAGDGMVQSTDRIFLSLESDNRNSVDAIKFLEVRIMDIYLGDWDRGPERWLWQRDKGESSDLWVPIRLFAEGAFPRYDGVVPWIGSFLLPQLAGFGENYPSVADLAWSGRHLDRWFLSPLDRAAWDSVTAVILSRLTDSVIAASVSKLPASVYVREGPGMIQMLKARRAGLPVAAGEYYRWLAETVDIRGSDRQEYAEVLRRDDAHVRVSVFACDGEGSPRRDRILYQREFFSEDTREIRLSMHGGDDVVVLRGSVESSIPVLVTGGEGNDRVVDSSHVSGYLFNVIPFIPDAETATYVYDSEESVIQEGSGMEVEYDTHSGTVHDVMRFTPPIDDRGTGWGLGVMFDWNSRLGIIAGAGPTFYRYGYRQDPYAYRLSLVAGYAPFANVGSVVFNADTRSMLRNASVSLDALASGYEVLTHYGPGNETMPRLEQNDEYYWIHQLLFKVEPSLRYPAHGPFSGMLKAGIRYVRTDVTENNYVTEVRPYGVENMVLATVGVGVRWDTRDMELHPYSGLLVDLAGTLFPKAFTAGEAFGKARGDVRLFIAPGESNALTLSLRLLGEKTWGKVPYFEAATVGSGSIMRGYQPGRFSGNGSLAAALEARVRAGELNIVFPSTVGVFGFVETGRVFAPGEVSRKWHPSYGCGVWAAPWNRETTVMGSLGFSDESVLMYGSIGFSF